MKQEYKPKITVQKASVTAGVGAVGVVAEIIVGKLLPGWFPPGTITAALTTLWVGFENWRKNK
jgi:hypothetical protein